jgi:hypothetical protein
MTATITGPDVTVLPLAPKNPPRYLAAADGDQTIRYFPTVTPLTMIAAAPIRARVGLRVDRLNRRFL